MNRVIHRTQDRGHAHIGWLQSHYSFSFANWYDPLRMGFGPLRVINEDYIAPGTGFGMHGHSNMEIITIVTKGTLSHTDSLGNTGLVHAGEVQVMSAGTGVQHAECNASPTQPLALFQIWIEPSTKNVQPRYAQQPFPQLALAGTCSTELVHPLGKVSALGIHQEAYIHKVSIAPEEPLFVTPKNTNYGMYIFVVTGSVEIGNEQLQQGDAIGIVDPEVTPITATIPSEVLIFEV